MNIWQRFVGFFRGLGWSIATWTRIGIWTIFAIILMVAMRSCAGGSTENGTNAGNGIWILLGGGLIVAAVISRERPYLAWTFAGFAGLVLLILMGKSETFFSWTVIGLPFFAAVGFWGCSKVDGGRKTFLGFASGIVIIFWMYLFYQDHSIENLGFIGRTFFPDDTAKSIFVVFLAVFFFWFYYKKLPVLLVSLLIFVSFLGNGMVNEIFKRFPEKLTPSFSEKWGEAYRDVRDSSLDKISGAATGDRNGISNAKEFIVLGPGRYLFPPNVKILVDGDRDWFTTKILVLDKKTKLFLSDPSFKPRKEE